MYRPLFRSADLALLGAAALTAAVLSAAPARAEFQLFKYNGQAQQSCPGDQVVWFNTGTGSYYMRAQNGYATTYTGPGAFACRTSVEENGYRPGADFGRQDLGQRQYRLIEPEVPAGRQPEPPESREAATPPPPETVGE